LETRGPAPPPPPPPDLTKAAAFAITTDGSKKSKHKEQGKLTGETNKKGKHANKG